MIKKPEVPLAKRDARMPSLDALRAVAAFSVLLVHWCGWISGKVPEAPWLQQFADTVIQTMLRWYAHEDHEFAGVILFIVLSGFCIHWPQAHLPGAPSWRVFAVRRFWRIYPVFLAASMTGLLVLHQAVRGGHEHALAIMGYREHEWWHVAAKLSGVSHFFPGASFEQTFLGNAPLATVVTECWLYAFYPVVLWLRSKAGWPTVFAVAGLLYSLCPWIARSGGGFGMTYDSFFCYLIFWVLGAWLAERLKTGRTAPARTLIVGGFAGLLLQIVVVMILPVRVGRFVSMLMLASAFGALITGFARRDLERAAGNSPRQNWLSWLGERSYSIYAFHAPLMAAGLMVALAHGASLPPQIAIAILCAPIFVGMVLYSVIEAPSHRLARKLAARIRIE